MKAGENSIRLVEHTWASGFIFSVLTTSTNANQGAPSDLHDFSSSSSDVRGISENALTPTGTIVQTAGPLPLPLPLRVRTLYLPDYFFYFFLQEDFITPLSGSRDENDWPFITSFT